MQHWVQYKYDIFKHNTSYLKNLVLTGFFIYIVISKNYMSVDSILTALEYLSIVFALISGLVYYKRLETGFLLILFQVVLGLTIESWGLATRYSGGNNNAEYNIYILVLFPVLILSAQKILGGIIKYHYFTMLVGGYLCLWVFFLIKNKVNNFQNYTYVVGSFMVVVLFLLIILANFPKKNFIKTPLFLLSCTMIFFYSCVSPSVSLLGYLFKSKSLTQVLYKINLLPASTIYYILIGVSFWLCRNKTEQAKSHEYRQ